MKRTAGAFMLLACLGGCMQTDKVQTPTNGRGLRTQKPAPYQGPYGEPIAAGNNPAVGMSPGLKPMGFIAGNNPTAGTDLIQAGYLKAENDPDTGIRQANHVPHAPPVQHTKHVHPYTPDYKPLQGIVPVPQMGPPGAVAAVLPNMPQMPQQPFNMRSSVNFASPDGMRLSWFGPTGWSESPLITPARYNFLQGGIYRLKLSSVPNRLEKVYYPTLEVVPGNDKSAAYLAHSSIPVTFTDEDFEQVDSNNMLIKVVYLPDLANQELATVVGPNELVSTRLEPGIDPIVEAQRRGTILLIIRLGNIDLNAPNSPAMDAPSPFMNRGMPMMAPPPNTELPGAPMLVKPPVEKINPAPEKVNPAPETVSPAPEKINLPAESKEVKGAPAMLPSLPPMPVTAKPTSLDRRPSKLPVLP